MTISPILSKMKNCDLLPQEASGRDGIARSRNREKSQGSDWRHEKGLIFLMKHLFEGLD